MWVDDLEDLYRRIEGLTNIILETDYISGYTFTQLYDIEQEVNGIYYFDRTPKLDITRINKIFSRVNADIQE
jgi:hypothetical protein